MTERRRKGVKKAELLAEVEQLEERIAELEAALVAPTPVVTNTTTPRHYEIPRHFPAKAVLCVDVPRKDFPPESICHSVSLGTSVTVLIPRDRERLSVSAIKSRLRSAGSAEGA